MAEFTLPPLPEADTHCEDLDTGEQVWSHSADDMHAYATAAAQPLIARIAALEAENAELRADARRLDAFQAMTTGGSDFTPYHDCGDWEHWTPAGEIRFASLRDALDSAIDTAAAADKAAGAGEQSHA